MEVTDLRKKEYLTFDIDLWDEGEGGAQRAT